MTVLLSDITIFPRWRKCCKQKFFTLGWWVDGYFLQCIIKYTAKNILSEIFEIRKYTHNVRNFCMSEPDKNNCFLYQGNIYQKFISQFWSGNLPLKPVNFLKISRKLKKFKNYPPDVSEFRSFFFLSHVYTMPWSSQHITIRYRFALSSQVKTKFIIL